MSPKRTDMAVNKKGSRNISVEGKDFHWRVTGSDEVITVVLWPVSNENSRVIASVGYHHDMRKVTEGHHTSDSQLVVTNRVIRALILHVGVEEILNNHGQINVGPIEAFYDVSKALRGQYSH